MRFSKIKPEQKEKKSIKSLSDIIPDIFPFINNNKIETNVENKNDRDDNEDDIDIDNYKNLEVKIIIFFQALNFKI